MVQHSTTTGSDGFDPHEFLAALRSGQPIRTEFVEHLHTKWRRIAGRRCYSFSVVDDAINDTWVCILQKWDQVGSPSRIEAWTNQIFVRCALNRLCGKRCSTPNEPLDSAPEPRDPSANPEQHLLRRRTHQRLREAMVTLTPIQRRVLLLYIIAAQPAKLVARAVDRDAVRVRHIGMEVRRRLADACVELRGAARG